MRKDHGPESGCSFTRAMVEAPTFWSHVARGDDDACWLWVGGKGPGGYGVFRVPAVRKGPIHAHRVAYVLAHGRIPAGQCVMHTCDNPPCVNPSHLKLGTHRENMHDMIAKGRSRLGSKPREYCKYGHNKGASRRCWECRERTNAAARERHSEQGRAELDAYIAEYIRPVVPSTLTDLIAITDVRRAHVIARSFGLYGFRAETLTDIGADLGITRERTRQLRNDSMAKIGVRPEALEKIPASTAFKKAA